MEPWMVPSALQITLNVDSNWPLNSFILCTHGHIPG